MTHDEFVYNLNQANELYHHGVKGQKWGVRRYVNYNGSYTQAGLKRYNKSKNDYEVSKTNLDTAKKLYKHGGVAPDGREIVISKNVVKQLKQQTKTAKKQMNKDYRHLKEDKKADKGKVRYSRGERITANNNVSSALISIGSLSITAATYAMKNNMVQKQTATALAGIGAASIAGGVLYKAGKSIPNNQLRAYYGHTSKY